MKLNQTFGCVRVAYNWTLSQRKETKMTYAQSSDRFFVHRKTDEMPWLRETSSSAQQQAIRDLQSAFKNFFDKRSGFPRFKSKRARQTARFCGKAFTLRDGALKVERVPGLIQVRWSRELPSDPSSVTVERDVAGRYFASFTVVVNPDPLPVTTKQTGIDLGISDLFVTSDGHLSGNPRHLKQLEARIALLQRRGKNKMLGSRNRNKHRRKIARLQSKVADRRHDFLHRASTELVRHYDTIVVEDLKVSNMVKNHCLAKAIMDCGWTTFVNMLEYKAEWYGKEVIRVNPHYTSRDCSDCGFRTESMPLSVREWTCESCGAEHHRDVNAAKNILAAGLAVKACGADVRPPVSRDGRRTAVKQETLVAR